MHKLEGRQSHRINRDTVDVVEDSTKEGDMSVQSGCQDETRMPAGDGRAKVPTPGHDVEVERTS